MLFNDALNTFYLRLYGIGGGGGGGGGGVSGQKRSPKLVKCDCVWECEQGLVCVCMHMIMVLMGCRIDPSW